MSIYGYDFYFKDGSDVLTLPITPGELTIKSGSKNKVISLISEGEVNLLKSPSLTEVKFEARFPMRKYPYSRNPSDFITYFDTFKKLKEEKKPFRFIVVRTTPKGKLTWDTNLLVSMEDLEINENADEGDDVIVTFDLKQYKEYGIKTIKTEESVPPTTSTSDEPRGTEGQGEETSKYTVQYGDCLWNIAKAAYGDGSKWKAIYEANKEAIEADAKAHGYASSSNGNLIFPGLELVIPGVDAANLIVQKLSYANNNNNNGHGSLYDRAYME